MTKEQFEKAAELSKQIEQIKDTVRHMDDVDDCKLEPMTRQSGIYLRFGINESSPSIHLSEGEAVCIKKALESEIAILRREFERL